MLDIRPLPPDLQKIACVELNEVPERMEQDLNDFRDWIEKQMHLNARTDDQFLVSFLRGCKYSMEKAKSKMDNYYTLKTKYPEFFTIQNIDDPKMVELCKMGLGIHLPLPLHGNGPRLQYIRAGIYPTDKYTFADVMCLASAFQVLSLLIDDYCVINGYVQIMDFSGYTVSHMLQMTPSVIKKMSMFAEDAIPLRQRATHFINTPMGFDRLFNMTKHLMPLKQQERLYVHGHDLQSLFEHVPQKYLPKELGGENSSIEEINRVQWQAFQEYRDYFIEDLKYGVHENYRLENKLVGDDLLGIDGSFRKLQVD